MPALSLPKTPLQWQPAWEEKQFAENQLKQMMGNHEIGTVGNRVITWKSVCQERLDTKALKEEHPELYKKYVNKTSYRRFSVKAG